MTQASQDPELQQRIRRDLRFLFERYGAIITSNTRQPYGNSQISLAAGNVEFQFDKNERDGECRVLVAPREGYGVWEIAQVALSASIGDDGKALAFLLSYSDDPVSLSYVGLTELTFLLESRFDRLNEAFTYDNYPATRLRMAEVERELHRRR